MFWNCTVTLQIYFVTEWGNMFKLFVLKFILIFLLLSGMKCLEAPQVNIPDQGIIIGTYLKMFRTQTIKAYLGIQYARSARFSPPEIRNLKGVHVINATSFGPDCWQKPSHIVNNQTTFVQQLLKGNKNMNASQIYDENCLYLNIYVPIGIPGNDGYAVVVWIHSGDFSEGSPRDINPFQMVFKQKIIVVTFSYRLNIFGFLSTGDGESSGNFGLMDQSAALFWIRKNINYFGGNENHITIMGHSAGAISVGLHLTSRDWSRDAFHKAILMSGNPLTEKMVHTADEYQNVLDSVANIFGCTRRPTSLLVHCLKRLDAKRLSDNVPLAEWGPVIDYGLSNVSLPFIEELPSSIFHKENMFQKIPVLMGMTDMEDVLFITDEVSSNMKTEDFDDLKKTIAVDDLHNLQQSDLWCTNFHIVIDALNYLYKNPMYSENNDDKLIQNFLAIYTDRIHLTPLYTLADILSAHEKTYVYLFDIKPNITQLKIADWVRVPKYFDQLYIWGVPFMDNSEYMQWSSVDKKISEIVMTMWANFIRFSNPTQANVYLKWIPYQSSSKNYLEINNNFSTRVLDDNINLKIDFWNNYYPNVLKFAIECCNMTNSVSHSLLQKQRKNQHFQEIIIILTISFWYCCYLI